MSANDFKRSTGYYTLSVLRANGLSPTLNNIYVKVQVKDVVQRTNVIGDVSEPWNECLPIRAANGRIVVSFTLMKRVPVFPYFRPVGTRDIQMTELVALCKGKEETELSLYLRKRSSSRRLVIKLAFSDVKTNASVAMNNLLSLVDDDGEIASESQKLKNVGSKLGRVVSQGNDIMQSNLGNAVSSALPNIDTFVSTVDKIVQNHPLLNVGWQLIAVAYKAVSDQGKLDERVNQLLRTAAFAFSFAQDSSLLNEGDDRLSAISQTVVALMDQLVGCGVFIREYARTTFLKRLVTQTSDNQKITRIEGAFQELRGNLEKGVDVQVGMFVKDIAGVFKSRAKVETLQEIKTAFDFTELMLRDMESSNHQECMPGTRTDWIERIVSWLLSDTDSEQNMLWVNGIPGSGKSTLAHSITMHPSIKKFLISHIFFKRETTRRHDVINLIAYRLALSNAAVASGIAARLRKPRLGLRDAFTNLILEPLIEAANEGHLTEPIVIILDALDEYGTVESRADFMKLLSNDFSKLPHRVRFLITSRPEDDLVRALRLPQRTHVREETLEINTDDSKRDVRLYIEANMKMLVSNELQTRGGNWDDIMQKFEQAADGLFIWGSVAIQIVKDAHRPYKTICALANNEHRLTLDHLYQRALAAIPVNWKDEEVRKDFAMLFTLILTNRGSLTIDLFDLLLAFEADSSEKLLLKFQSFLSCGRYKIIQIHHKTFAEFAQSPDRSPDDPWYIDLPRWREYILFQCFTALGELHFDMCGAVTGSGSGEISVGNIPAHIIHASLYWSDHLKDAEYSKEALERLRTFLDTNLLYWFEVVSLTKEFSRVAHQALSTAIDWVSGHSTSTTSFLMDARSIVSKFSKAMAKSPVLIYSTALPLTLSTNSVTHQYHALLADHSKLRMARIDFEINDEQSIAESDLQAFQSSGYVSSAIFSVDLHYVISTSGLSINVWNAHTGEEIRRLWEHSDVMLDLAVSPGGDIIASASVDKTIRLWDTETGAPIGNPLKGHTNGVNCVAFSPNGKNIASGSYGTTVRQWSVETGQAIGKPFTGHKWVVTCVAYSPDGKRFASGSGDGIIIWDIESNTSVVTLEKLGGAVCSLAFSPNGRWLASAIGKEVRIWNAMTGECDGEPLRGHTDNVKTVYFSPDNSRVVSGSDDGTVRIWSVETREEVMPPLQYGRNVFSVAYSQDGSRILSAGEGGITIWNSLTGKRIIGRNQPTYNLEGLAPDGSNLNLDDCQLFQGWSLDGGWLRGPSGEYRVLLLGYMRKLVRQVDEGVYVHHRLHLSLCNATAEGFKGFTFTS